MAFAKVYSAQPSLKPHLIDVEIDTARGLHSFSVVGLPTKAVEESRDRVSAAIKNIGFTSPKQKNQKTTVSLAPATLKKEDAVFDLAIATGYLITEKVIQLNPENKLFIGELALDGTLRPIKGTLAIAKEVESLGFKEIFLPPENAPEASMIKGLKVYPVSNLKYLVSHFIKEDKLDQHPQLPRTKIRPAPQTPKQNLKPEPPTVDLSDIRGQNHAKRALEIAAAGLHHLSLFGPPGTGKTMLAQAFRDLLPELSEKEAFEVTAIHSLSGTLDSKPLLTNPPLRSPHHSSSYVAITGGGAAPKPGEITLAHRGVLFMDEFPEFDRKILEALRQPLEERNIHVSRAKESITFPADFVLIAAMNPCPCGYFSDQNKRCVCRPYDIIRYQKKISGPIADRIEIWTEVGQIKPKELSLDQENQGETTAQVQKRVRSARKIQTERFSKETIDTNSQMSVKQLKKYARLTDSAQNTLNQVAEKLDMSGRSYHRIIKVARTIADLAQEENINDDHILEAAQYRPKQEVRL